MLFARDHRLVSRFYQRVLGAAVLDQDDHHVLLDVQGFQLVIHAIRPSGIEKLASSGVSERREEGVVRLEFSIPDISVGRAMARELGGSIDDLPPSWAGGDNSFFLGVDPEGNVAGFRVLRPATGA